MLSRMPMNIIILTCNRPDIMIRCVNQIKLFSNDNLIIVDDSSNKEFINGKLLLEKANITYPTFHISTKQAFKSLKQLLPSSALLWTLKCGRRDISPQRNLALLFSIFNENESNLLIDDDITSFNIGFTRKKILQIKKTHKHFIAGVHISGIDERSSIERFKLAIENTKIKCNSTKELFKIPAIKILQKSKQVNFVSGGYLSFNISKETTNMLSFPPGYNEDWIWCYQNKHINKVKVFRLPQVVIHDPPEIKNISINDLEFEILGEIIVDLVVNNLLEYPYKYSEEHSLELVKQYIPINLIVELIDLYDNCKNKSLISRYGLENLIRFYKTTLQNYNWIEKFKEWEHQTKITQNSFGITLSLWNKNISNHIFLDRRIN